MRGPRHAALVWSAAWLAFLLVIDAWCWAEDCLTTSMLIGLALWIAIVAWEARLALHKRHEPGQIRTLTGVGHPRREETVSTDPQPLTGDQQLPLGHEHEHEHEHRHNDRVEHYERRPEGTPAEEPTPTGEPAEPTVEPVPAPESGPGTSEAAGGEHTGPGRE